MSKNKKLVVANWKMNPQTPEEAKTIFVGTRKATEKLKQTEAIVCPPSIYFAQLAKLVPSKAKAGGTKIKIGGQNVFWEPSGSFTGETSAEMLSVAGATHVIVGHSERRALGETDEMISKKVSASIQANIITILCIGERERDHHGNYLSFLKHQIMSGLSGVQKKNLFQIVIAYEPVWAIGKSESEALTGSGMHEMTIFIRKILSDMYGRDNVSNIPILYGGSVSPNNAGNIVSEGYVDGLLVGRQSLDPALFTEILKIVDSL